MDPPLEDRCLTVGGLRELRGFCSLLGLHCSKYYSCLGEHPALYLALQALALLLEINPGFNHAWDLSAEQADPLRNAFHCLTTALAHCLCWVRSKFQLPRKKLAD